MRSVLRTYGKEVNSKADRLRKIKTLKQIHACVNPTLKRIGDEKKENSK
jgi:uncharacterized protein YlbG (UPF0298 family)